VTDFHSAEDTTRDQRQIESGCETLHHANVGATLNYVAYAQACFCQFRARRGRECGIGGAGDTHDNF
jgi:hypothetical protein